MNPPFYRAFEDRYRGSRELIKSRLAVYLPFIRPLQSLYANCTALDVGCGRGEWLELLLAQGFDAQGVDLDEGMLATCLEMQLPAVLGDAIVALQNLPDESLSIVSGFHLAEHIPFESLQTLVSEALRVLKPAGLLILETPNAENITVGAHTFYMDPTHEKPIPYPLLSFLTEYAGFARNKLLRLQEDPDLLQGQQASLIDVLQGVSPDYAIVAQKQAPARQMVLFDSVFLKDYGLALGTIGHRYEVNQNNRFSELANQQQQTQAQLDQLQASAQNWYALSESRQQQLEALLNSKSWRLTLPLRQGAAVLRPAVSTIKTKTKALLRPLIRQSMNYVLSRSALRNQCNRWLQRYPALYSRLIRFARHHGLVSGGNQSYAQEESHSVNQQPLTPRAQQIYTELKQAIQTNKKEVK